MSSWNFIHSWDFMFSNYPLPGNSVFEFLVTWKFSFSNCQLPENFLKTDSVWSLTRAFWWNAPCHELLSKTIQYIVLKKDPSNKRYLPIFFLGMALTFLFFNIFWWFFFRIKMRTNCVDSARFGSVLSRLDRVPPRVSQSAPGPTRARNPLHTARDPFKICQNVASRKSRLRKN